jgi:hypothetical protein
MSATYHITGKRLSIPGFWSSLTLMVLGIAMTSLSAAQGSEPPPRGDTAAYEYDVKAVFLYHFTRYLQWPEVIQPEAFTIVVLGKSGIVAPLQEIAKKKTVGLTPIMVRQCLEIGQIGHPRILFIAKSALPRIAQVLEKTQGTDILTVSEMEGLSTRGVAVNFVERDGKIKFEMNEKMLKDTHIQIGSQLLKLAILVDAEKVGGER